MRAALIALLALAGPRDLSAPGIGDAAPPLELETLDGQVFPRARLAGGGVTVVDFFATWCKPCHQGMRDLMAIREALGPGVRFVLVDVNEDAGTVRRFLAKRPLPDGVEVALDRGGGTARRWGQREFPTTFLVDDAGIIRYINRGWGGGYRARVQGWLQRMQGTADGPKGPAAPPKAPRREVVKGVEILRGE